MSIGRSLQRRNIFALIEVTNLQELLLLLQQQQKDGGITPLSTAQKPRYFNPSTRKRTSYASLANQQPKPKMSNSFEYLQGSITEIQKKYEMLSDIVTEYGGKGSWFSKG